MVGKTGGKKGHHQGDPSECSPGGFVDVRVDFHNLDADRATHPRDPIEPDDPSLLAHELGHAQDYLPGVGNELPGNEDAADAVQNMVEQQLKNPGPQVY